MKIGDLIKIKESSKIGVLLECSERRKFFHYGHNNNVWLVFTQDCKNNLEWVYENSIEVMGKNEK